MKYSVILLVVLLWVFQAVEAIPLAKLTTTIDETQILPQDLLSFMRRFGYLDGTPKGDAEALYHKTAIIDAIKNVQKYGGLQATGTLDISTMELLRKPRCGVADMTRVTKRRNRRYTLDGPRPWSKRLITYFIANNSKRVPVWQVERDIARSLQQWSRYSGLEFERINNTSADIIIGFGSHYHGDSYPFDGAGNTLAHAFYPYDEGDWGGDVHFDDDENWLENAVNLTSGVDFYTVALHELGHSLGLEHSTIYSSIMFPYYKGPQQTNFNYDDALALYNIYLKYRNDVDVHIDVGEVEGSQATQSLDTAKKQHLDTKRTPSIGHPCRGHFDSVTILNGFVHIFKGPHVWQLTPNYTLQNDTPSSLYDIFPFLNATTTQRIDAAFVRQDGILVIFTGQVYWVVNGTQAIEGSPRTLASLLNDGEQMRTIDAAFLWPKNSRVYLFAGDQFWRMDELMQTVDHGYPKNMSRWPGIPHDLDAAVTLANGKTYFFKDTYYWLFNNAELRAERGYPRLIFHAWLHCAPRTTRLRNHNTTVIFIRTSA